MRIGIDISQIVYEGTGVGRFTRGLTEAILEYNTNHTWIFFFSHLRKKLDPQIKNAISMNEKTVLKEFLIPPTVLSFIWNSLHILPIEKLIGNIDWFISSDWTEPPSKCFKTSIVHDLVFKKFPETVHQKILHTQEKRLSHIVKETKIIITDSISTKNDLMEIYNVTESKLKTIYPGFHINTSSMQDDIVLKKYKLNYPYVITVGKQEPRKNLTRLLKVFNNLYKNKNINTDLKLLIVGSIGWGNVNTTDNNSVIFTGYVPDSELHVLYKNALCLIFPSLYEGFGYPAIEAMSLGCPVTMSDTSSLSEIGKENSALFFDPLDEKSIESSLIRIINDKKLRTSLSKNGRKRASQFTWKNYHDNLINQLELVKK